MWYILCCSFWNWRGYRIRYQFSGETGPALVLVHGFGANRYASFTSLLVIFLPIVNAFHFSSGVFNALLPVDYQTLVNMN